MDSARAEVVTAIVTAQESMSASAEHLNNSVVELVTRARKPTRAAGRTAVAGHGRRTGEQRDAGNWGATV